MNVYDEIYLETDEEVTSAIEKIKKSKKKNVALCLPRHAVMGQSIVNLKLLYKEAIASGKKLALVSSDKITRALADKVGFLTFEQAGDIVFGMDNTEVMAAPKPVVKEPEPTPIAREQFPIADKKTSDQEKEAEVEISEAIAKGFTKQVVAESPIEPDEVTEGLEEELHVKEKSTGPQATKQARPLGGMIPTKGNLRFYRQSKRKPLLIPLLVALGVVMIAGVSAALAIPRATVDITVSAQPFNETVNSNVDVEATGVDVTKSTIPGKLLTLEYETKSSAKATGKKDTGEKATGMVTLYNEWDDKTHTFVAGTKLRAKNGNEFVLTDDIALPGASISRGIFTGGKKAASVVAVAAGPNYNNSPTTFTIPTLSKAEQEKIYATSSEAFTGGTSNVVTVVTQSDITKLVESVKVQNRDDAIASLKQQAEGAIVLDKAIQVVTQDVTDGATADTIADTLEATVKGTFQVITFSQADHKALLEKLLESKIPQGQKIVTEGDGVTIDTSQFDLNLVSDKRLELTNNLKAFTVTFFDEGAVRRSLAGITPETTKDIIAKRVPVKDVKSTISPTGWPRLPYLSSKIQVTYRYAAQE